MESLNQDPIHIGLLIANNTKFMVDVPQRACEHFCVINELCRLARVPTHHDDVIMIPLSPINKRTMREIHTHLINKGIQGTQ